MLYFRYKRRPYRPAEDWYDAERIRRQFANPEAGRAAGPWFEKTPAPDWRRVDCDYDYLLVTLPFDRDIIAIPTRRVAANETAALLKVEPTAKGGCGVHSVK